MINVNTNDEHIPMKIIEEIAKEFNSKIIAGIDVDYMVYVYIEDISRIKENKYLSDATGRGETYEKACLVLINLLLNKNYNIRYKNKIYATERARKIILDNNIHDYYDIKGDI